MSNTPTARVPDTLGFGLAALRWHRAEITLRNTANTFARAHPLVVLGALLMHAAPASLKPEHKPRRFLFRLHHPVGERIHKDQQYTFSLLLLGADPGECDAFAAALSRPLANFELVSLSGLRERTVADLLDENPRPPADDEICLEFLTPLSFQPVDATRPWQLSPVQLGALLVDQLTRRFPASPLEIPSGLWQDFEVLGHYWRQEEIGAASRFSDGRWKTTGHAGPLYIRGPLANVWPLLLLAAELPLGDAKIGGGAALLRPSRSALAVALHNPATYLAAQADLAERTDLQDEFHHALREPGVVAAELAAAVKSGAWRPGIARAFQVRKEGGGERLVALLPPRDFVLHKALHGVLAPWFDRAFEPAAVGYRPGVSPEKIRARIRAAYREGRVWALRADIEEFFDQIDWALLDEHIARVLPRADAPVAALLSALVRAPLSLHDSPLPRERGLVQGSPLSPLLANLYLDGFDEEMALRGLCHVRFADDLLVLCFTEAEAQAALSTLGELLAPLRLRLKEAKTAILPADAGFRFLGDIHGGGLDPAAVAEAGARRTLYVRDFRAWVGADHDALTVRAGAELLARVPFRRLDGVVLLGAGGISTRALERLDDWGLPLVVCSASGRPVNTLAPRGREHFATGSAHAERHAGLDPAGLRALARRLVQAKLHNHAAWLAELPGEAARAAAGIVADALAALPTAATVDALRGHEGIAARALFRFVNDRAGDEWRSELRIAHERRDPWNSLLDFASHLLFSRLLVLLLQNGLNPWLGFLHSAQNRYESLACDLQEPFRPRLERFILKLVNRKVVQTTDFEPHPRGGTRLTRDATARFLEHWERELLTRYSGDPAHLLDLLEAQVLSLKSWARGDREPGIYQANRRRHERGPAKADKTPKSKTHPTAETPPETKREADSPGEVSGNELASDSNPA